MVFKCQLAMMGYFLYTGFQVDISFLESCLLQATFLPGSGFHSFSGSLSAWVKIFISLPTIRSLLEHLYLPSYKMVTERHT